MRLVIANLVAIFWALIFGEILGYICGQLEILSIQPMEMGIIAVVIAVFAVNVITAINKNAEVKS